MTLRGFQPGSHAYIRAIVGAQMLAQIGAFALPALLPGYIDRCDLSKSEARWLVGILFAAGVGISGAASFAIAGLIDRVAGPKAAFLVGAATAFAAVLVAATVMPAGLSRQAPTTEQRRLLDFRPVFRNRAAMGWIAGYTVHTWELAALRAWGVTFLAVVIAQQGAPSW